MKSNIKKRVLAVVLCMVLMLSTGISTMADGEVAAGTPAPESGASQEPAAASVEGEAVEGETVEGEQTPAEQSTETQEETPTEPSAAESKDEPAADINSVSGVTELVGSNGIQNEASEQETETDLTEQEPEVEIVSEATELKQEFTDEAGNVTQRVIANIPEGAFQANASEITMEVNYLDEAAENHVKELMTAALPENEILGDYILYDIKFKVNGEVTEPQKAIAITFEGSGLHIEDTKKANVFYLDPADPEVQDDKDEIVEITQKSEMIENLQNAGQSIENIDEYDLSEISVKEDGTADQILMEGRISTVYGCYVEKTPVQVLEYSDDDVTINVNAYTEDAIPAGASLKVVPLQSDNKDTEEQYKEVEEQLNKRAETEEYDVAGFLAYDISFINENGEEVEPNGDVKVAMNYKKEIIPEGVEDSSNLDVTVMHLEEDEAGDVKDVVDMVADASKEATVETTDDAKVKKAEFVTDGFSKFVITWTSSTRRSPNVTVYYVNESGTEITSDAFRTSELDVNTGAWVSLDSYAPSSAIDTKGDTYDYLGAHLDTYTGTEAKSVYAYRENRSWSFLYRNSVSGDSHSWQANGSERKIYLVYEKDTSSGGGDEEEIAPPTHHKYIEKLDGDNYELSLDVTGAEKKMTPVDILLIVDTSGSMANKENYYDSLARWESVNKALEVLETQLKATIQNNSNVQFNICMTTFGFDAATSPKMPWTKLTENTTITRIKKSDCNGGTNWEDGFIKGAAQFKNRTNERYVVFLTDGDPSNWVNDNGSRGGTGDYTNASNVKESYNQAIASWNSTIGSTGAKTFVVKASKSAKYCQNLVDDPRTDAELIDGTSTENMERGFSQIVANIIPNYKDVSITDTLSEYVSFPEGFTKEGVKVYTVTKDSDGKDIETPFDGKYDTTISDNAVTVKLLNGAELEEGVTYRIKFGVVVSDKAKEEYAANPKDDRYGGVTGDANTDHPNVEKDKQTSSNKPGFYSNDASQTYVSYTAGMMTGLKAKYEKPVIQVDPESIHIPEESNPIDGSITKVMGTVREDGKYPINLQVKTRLEETSKQANVDVILVIDNSNSMDGNRLSQTKIAANAFVNGFVGADGNVSENHRIGIVTFCSSSELLTYSEKQYFSGDVDVIKEKINEISVGTGDNGGTNTAAGLKNAYAMAESTHNKKYVILLTDGVPTFHDTDTWGGGTWTNTEDMNQAVEAAVELDGKVDGIYTIGLLTGYSEKDNQEELDIARTLLASPNSEHQDYPVTYKLKSSTNKNNYWEYEWDKSISYSYSDGYYEIISAEDAGTKLKDIWTELAKIINNKTNGSTGDGWIVTDTMADYVTFSELEGATINGYILKLSEDKKILTTAIDGKEVTVASYEDGTRTITWNLNAALADTSIKYNGGTDYTYNLTYYIDLDDSSKTEFQKTNKTTYVTPKEKPDEPIYPPQMPFFVNIIGSKLDNVSSEALTGAKFSVYRDITKTKPIAKDITSDTKGHFAFQIGQSDMSKIDDRESYTMTVYLEETEAPYGYVTDGTLHEVTITVPNVTYNEQGVPTGSAMISYISTGNDDLLSVDNQGDLKLLYANKANPGWGIIKRSASNHDNYLEGAEFGLYKKNNNSVDRNPSYTGKSNSQGLINVWKDVSNGNAEIKSQFIPAGTYILKETKAPNAYQLSDEEWTITITEKGNVSVKDKSGATINEIVNLPEIEGLDKNSVYFYFDNTILYELPSTGGSGIFLYMVGGVLLMMAASLLLYKNKSREVLER